MRFLDPKPQEGHHARWPKSSRASSCKSRSLTQVALESSRNYEQLNCVCIFMWIHKALRVWQVHMVSMRLYFIAETEVKSTVYKLYNEDLLSRPFELGTRWISCWDPLPDLAVPVFIFQVQTIQIQICVRNCLINAMYGNVWGSSIIFCITRSLYVPHARGLPWSIKT